jgi:hypothetical protein
MSEMMFSSVLEIEKELRSKFVDLLVDEKERVTYCGSGRHK